MHKNIYLKPGQAQKYYKINKVILIHTLQHQLQNNYSLSVSNLSKNKDKMFANSKHIITITWEWGNARTSVEDMNLVGLTVIFAVTTKYIDKSATFDGVAGVTPPLPWPSTTLCCCAYRLHLNLFPPHFR